MTGPAMGDVDVGQVVLDGKKLSAQVRAAVEDAVLRRSLDEGETVTFTLSDPKRKLLTSGLFDTRVTVNVDGLVFDLAQVRKTGDVLKVMFESAVIADLRRQTGRLTVKSGTTTRADFIRRLAEEPGWITVETEPGDVTKVALSRGSDRDPQESSWAAIGRLAEEVGSRRLVTGETLLYGSDAWLKARTDPTPLTEYAGGVDVIDFDFDIGKDATDATVECRAARWSAGPGTPVEVQDLGPGSGIWLVTEIERSLFSTSATITLSRTQPPLPEPEPDEPDVHDDPAGVPGDEVSAGAGTTWAWPVSGRISGRFGDPRPGHTHKGLDIAAPSGTPIVAAAGGRVSRAGWSDSYGWVVYLDHDGGAQTRYAHMVRRPAVRVGQTVDQGAQLGAVGSTGRSSGPHLHFEIRQSGRAVNPEELLP